MENGSHTVVELVFMADWAHKNDKDIQLHLRPLPNFVSTNETYASEKGMLTS